MTRCITLADYRPNTHLRMLLQQMVEETANRIIAQRKEAIETGTVPAPKDWLSTRSRLPRHTQDATRMPDLPLKQLKEINISPAG